ncbi:mannose-6-phosphate isomerase, class I [Leucobacter sp. W1478]|uniref:mannose-6-phosphate isomerase, class I n=1 Tax=Leucobacter sp. W1478 TaxID=3439065 RepID=UPI003F3BC1B9
MLIFIENAPRAYAWGSRDALPELLGTAPTGEPQAELWLGAHPGAPATLAKATPVQHTLIDLIEADPERYGVDGGQLPFLLKILAIGGPLSLQVHPNRAQAEAGYAREEAAGVPRDARERNYGDRNHKPELLVALSEVSALSGFRDLSDARADLRALAAAAPAGAGRDALAAAAARCTGRPERARTEFLSWALRGGDEAGAAVRAIHTAVRAGDGAWIEAHRLAALRDLTVSYPGDPGVLVSLLLHLVRLAPGEAIYLGARQLHAYLGGLAVEVMAASDNVLRAGLTPKHIDADELLRVTDTAELIEPRQTARRVRRGLVAWEPPAPDFKLLRAKLCIPGDQENGAGEILVDDADRAESVVLEAPHPLVLVVTAGRVRVERPSDGEVASVRRGQSLYISSGEPIELSGAGDAFVATVGDGWD